MIVREEQLDNGYGLKKRLLKLLFGSPYDLYHSVDYALKHPEKSKNHDGGKARALYIKNDRECSSSFAGASWKESEERRYYWKGGLDKIKKLAAMDAVVHASTYVRQWSDYDGDSMDVERFYNEQPFLVRRVKVAGTNRRGQYRIVVNISENAFVSAQNMLWKAYAAARLCDEIESQGNRCEVIICDFASNQNPGYNYTLTEVVVKKMQEPVNLGLLCTMMSPWCLRTYMFMIWSHYHVCSDGFGRAASCRTYYGGDRFERQAILIDTGECLSHEKANNFIRTQDIGTEYEL